MHAFLSFLSACEALRSLEGPQQTWPPTSRKLPLEGDCVSNQRGFKTLVRSVDLQGFGVHTSPVDLLVPAQAMRSRGKDARFHVWSGSVPQGAMIRLSKELLLSGPELTVVQYCGAQSKVEFLLDEHARAVRAERDTLAMLGLDEEPVIDDPRARDSIERLVAAVVLACEFAGTYRLGVGGEETQYHMAPLMDEESFGQVISGVEGTANKTRAAEVAGLFYEGSASPMETALVLMLTLPVNFGGLGLPRAELNKSVDVSAVRGTLSDRDEVTPDLMWRWARVAVEYDSAEFHEQLGSRQLEEDARRSNILTTQGYRVLHVTPGVVRTVNDVELFARQIAHLLGVTLKAPSEIQALRRRRLFTLLMS